MKIYVAHASKWEYKEKLYEPIKNSKIYEENEVFLPHDSENAINSKEQIKESDLVIAEVSVPTIGLGIELGWAEYTETPILCIYKKGYEYSSSLKFITKNIIEYDDEQDMIKKIEEFLKEC